MIAMNNTASNSIKTNKKAGVNHQNCYDPSIVEPYNYSGSEQGIWRAVIVQALMDASSNSAKKENLQAKQEALVWLRGNSVDFASVCYYAGFEPEFVKQMAKQALQRNCVWRAAPNAVNASYQHGDKFSHIPRRHTQLR
jgi:hypothetical protein